MRSPLHVEDGLAVDQVVLVHVGAEIIHGEIIVVGLASDDRVSEWLRNADYECDEQHPHGFRNACMETMETEKGALPFALFCFSK